MSQTTTSDRRRASLRKLARSIAVKNGIPPRLFLALVDIESAWDPQAISPAGAIGLAQLMPGTARGLGVDPFVPRQNLDGGARYLKKQFDNFGNWRDALRAYNVGPNAIHDPQAGAGYADKVLSRRGSAPKATLPRGGGGAKGNLALAPSRPTGLDPLMTMAFEDDPEFLDLMRSAMPETKVSVGTAPQNPDFKTSGPGITLPTSWQGSHVTSGLGWGSKTAIDIMGKPGTPVRLPWSGEVVYFHPTGAQGGGAMLIRLANGREVWLGHITQGLRPGQQFRAGQQLAVISPDHDAPHVHADIR